MRVGKGAARNHPLKKSPALLAPEQACATLHRQLPWWLTDSAAPISLWFPLSNYSAILALLASVFLLIAGNGLVNTLVPLRASLEHFPPLAIGLMGSVYFGGMLAGTLAAPAVLRRTGHIRAYCAFISLAIITTLALPVLVAPLPWILVRGALGFAFAGLYGVIDGWVSAKSQNENRGRVYGLYQIVNFSGSAVGQQLLVLDDSRSFALFSLVAGLFALAVLPLAFTRAEAPAVPEVSRLRILWLLKISPVGAMTAFVVGAANGSFWALSPVYGLGIGLRPESLSLFLTAVVVGSAIAVWPIARLSDWMDRRKLVVFSSTLAVAAETGLWLGAHFDPLLVAGLGFALGSGAMVLYTLAVAQTNDRAGPSQAVIVTSGLLFLYCAGAILFPPLGSALIAQFGPTSLFAMNAVLHLSLVVFTLWRILARQQAAPMPRPESPSKGRAGMP